MIQAYSVGTKLIAAPPPAASWSVSVVVAFWHP